MCKHQSEAKFYLRCGCAHVFPKIGLRPDKVYQHIGLGSEGKGRGKVHHTNLKKRAQGRSEKLIRSIRIAYEKVHDMTLKNEAIVIFARMMVESYIKVAAKVINRWVFHQHY